MKYQCNKIIYLKISKEKGRRLGEEKKDKGVEAKRI